ncbi:MAG TPA: 1-deoxy-D-xylulose-5-phosphate reductoisomerase [Candidatus Cloacimonetes bacterium]|nr:1-deoxy-D-xylulose-5-phosphate reductoisomerase [Candidatus Cloacimonadota bacterium]HEX37302.1 1-deoxy-D-xylulose-5-phosphate reductoisomerase [Candidatus Cloacimonadota bacterium]
MKKIALLGATGSIGQSTLEVVRNHPDRFQIVIVSSHSKFELLQEITKGIPIEHIVMTGNENTITDPSVHQGEDALLELLRNTDYDILLNAVVGSAGLKYTVSGLESGHDVALANKESMVIAGEIVTEIARKNSCIIIPVDSEHSAIMQCLNGVRERSQVRKVILTASGGPFHNLKKEAFKNITLRDALQHPNWAMGNKITIDSATMANKGLEVIEAHYLFDMPYEDIDVIIHPQSIIHSMIEFIDGSIIAQLSFPDMKIPIQYALSYPNRIRATAEYTDLSQIHELTFYKPNYEKFPLLKLAFEVGKAKGIMPTIFNAANEAAVTLFLKEKISFIEIPEIIENELSRNNIPNPDLETIISIDTEIKKKIFNAYK